MRILAGNKPSDNSRNPSSTFATIIDIVETQKMHIYASMVAIQLDRPFSDISTRQTFNDYFAYYQLSK